jgi:hypothetical protein
MEEGRGGRRSLNRKEREVGPDLRKKPTGLKTCTASFLSQRRKSENTFLFHSPRLEKVSRPENTLEVVTVQTAVA